MIDPEIATVQIEENQFKKFKGLLIERFKAKDAQLEQFFAPDVASYFQFVDTSCKSIREKFSDLLPNLTL